MLSSDQLTTLTSLVNNSLDEAENTWESVGELIRSLAAFSEGISVPSEIPGYPFVSDGKPKVDDFICLVFDMRESTKHLMCQISEKIADVSMLKRVYYETSALLPATAKVISYGKGSVTEYLGDGVLALFRVDDESVISNAYLTASNCLECLHKVINPILRNRYRLPALSAGIGMARSDAIVTLVGLKQSPQAKVFGECVFRATKLSKGTNEIVVDPRLRDSWPSSKGGLISFRSTMVKGESGYVVYKKE
jgi:hypothetical protein